MKRIAIAAIFWTSAVSAAPANVDRCAQAAEDGQRLRDDNKLRGARDKFLECGSESCPLVIRKDCIRWKTELDAAIPNVVVRAVDKRGRDVSGAKIVVDGVSVRDRIDGTGVALDPGEHVIGVVATSGAKVDQKVVLVRSEHDRVITLSFDVSLETNGNAVVDAPLPPAPPPPEKNYAPAIMLGSAAVISLGVFTALDITAWGKYKDLENGCGQTKSCTDDEVSTNRTQFRIAGVALAAGVVLGVAAAYFFVRPPVRLTAGGFRTTF